VSILARILEFVMQHSELLPASPQPRPARIVANSNAHGRRERRSRNRGMSANTFHRIGLRFENGYESEE
jgi:hypothetical protein